ncbi:MAG TPA: NfeD family protein [Gemmatimonadaceae bacterium]|nr:NfeD family protein [Gemmatimonadaceae bacterium]
MTPLAIVFLIAFIASLVLAVIAMLHGVEHTHPDRTRAPSPFFNLPSYAAFGFGFGVVGYPLARRTALPAWAILLIALIAGALTVTGMITLLARWALRGASSTATHEDEIQGQLAVVTRDIQSNGPGEISYESFGKKVKIAAVGISAKQLPIGSEVVIERIENGVALVEEWAVVEQRI